MDNNLLGAKPLSEPMLAYCQWDPCLHNSGKFESKYNNSIDKNELENSSAK